MTAQPTTPAPYDPAPGTEYSYALSDYARAAARSLGAGWGAESGYLGASGLIYTIDGRRSLRLTVDDEDDLVVVDRKTGDVDAVPSFVLPECAPRTPDDMADWGDALGQFIGSLYS